MSEKSPTYWQDQFRNYVEERRKAGMTYMNITLLPRADGTIPTVEEVCEEFMRMTNAPSVPDPEVLGKYSDTLRL